MSNNKMVSLLCPLAFLGLGIFITTSSISMSRTDGLFPRIVGILMIGFALVQILTELKAAGGKNNFADVNFISLFLCIAGLCVYVFLLKKIGFFLDTLLLSLYNMFLLGYKKPVRLVASSLIISGVVFGVFYFLIKAPLPTLFL